MARTDDDAQQPGGRCGTSIHLQEDRQDHVIDLTVKHSGPSHNAYGEKDSDRVPAPPGREPGMVPWPITVRAGPSGTAMAGNTGSAAASWWAGGTVLRRAGSMSDCRYYLSPCRAQWERVRTCLRERHNGT